MIQLNHVYTHISNLIICDIILNIDTGPFKQGSEGYGFGCPKRQRQLGRTWLAKKLGSVYMGLTLTWQASLIFFFFNSKQQMNLLKLLLRL